MSFTFHQNWTYGTDYWSERDLFIARAENLGLYSGNANGFTGLQADGTVRVYKDGSIAIGYGFDLLHQKSVKFALTSAGVESADVV